MGDSWVQEVAGKAIERQERESLSCKWQIHSAAVLDEKALDCFRGLLKITVDIASDVRLVKIGITPHRYEESIYLISDKGVARIWMERHRIWVEIIIDRVSRDHFDLALENDGQVYIEHDGKRTDGEGLITLDRILALATEGL